MHGMHVSFVHSKSTSVMSAGNVEPFAGSSTSPSRDLNSTHSSFSRSRIDHGRVINLLVLEMKMWVRLRSCPISFGMICSLSQPSKNNRCSSCRELISFGNSTRAWHHQILKAFRCGMCRMPAIHDNFWQSLMPNTSNSVKLVKSRGR